MEKIIKIISIVCFVCSLAISPLMLGVGLFGLAGSTASYFVIIWLGYIGLVIFSFISYRHYKFFPFVIISLLAIVIGLTLDTNFWKKHNSDLCTELRSNPTCVEDACGFTCSDVDGVGFVTNYKICGDKDVNLCKEEMLQSQQLKKESDNVLNAYSNIVDKIISSPSPSSENFENELIAIYNCFESKYGPGTKGELMAVQVLTQKNLNKEELQKYYDYLASKGRNVNTSRIVAGLPNGDKSLSCDNLK